MWFRRVGVEAVVCKGGCVRVGGVLRRVCPGAIRWLVLAAAGIVLAACLLHDPSDEAKPNDVRAQSVTDQLRAADLSPKAPFATNDGGIGNPPPSAAAVYLGDTTAPVRAATDAGADTGSDGYDLNFENAPVTTVAKVILGDILGVGYIIDPRVQGTITLASGRAVSKADVLFVLENALRMSNVAMVRDRNGYRLIPAADATGSGFVDTDEATRAGYGVSVVPLRYVSAQAMLKLLDGFGIKPNAVRVDNARNLVIIQGTGPERRSAVETMLSFDGDWMRGQSVGVFPIHNSTPDPIITEIEKIMDTGEGGLSQNLIKFQPVARLNAILVVSRKPEYLKTVATWIKRLDESDTSGVNLKVYRLHYGSAKQVAGLLNEILVGRGASGLDTAQSQVAPGAGLSVASSGGPLSALSAQPQTAMGQAGGGGLGGGGLGGGVSAPVAPARERPRARQAAERLERRATICPRPDRAAPSAPAAPARARKPTSASRPTSSTIRSWSMPARRPSASSNRRCARSTDR